MNRRNARLKATKKAGEKEKEKKGRMERCLDRSKEQMYVFLERKMDRMTDGRKGGQINGTNHNVLWDREA